MMKCRLRVAVFSDIHLGHRRTPTESIVANLKKAVQDSAETSNLDIIFISGDLLDRLISMSGQDAYEMVTWLGYILLICKRRDIVLRILEGTPSHDWKQSGIADAINVGTELGADVKFVSTLSIEWIEKFGIHVLYIPDEWSPDLDDTRKQVQKLLTEHQLDQVDFTIMHGLFSFQISAQLSIPTHNEDWYSQITKYYVICGHDHTTKRYKNIIIPGSFDRLSHGEEEPKGHYLLTVDPNGDDSVVFIENVNATIYKSIDVDGLPIDDVLSKVEREVSGLPALSHIRLIAGESDVVSFGLDTFRKSYPYLHWTIKIDTSNRSKQNVLVDLRRTHKTTPINKQTIFDLVRIKLATMNQDESTIDRCLQALHEVAQ